MSQTMCKLCLKFKFFFLNLTSKFPASVRVRTSKYPYMDMSVGLFQKFNKFSVLVHLKHYSA